MIYQCKQVDIGDKCIECFRSTAFGTGLYVNRLSADKMIFPVFYLLFCIYKIKNFWLICSFTITNWLLHAYLN